MALIQSAPAPLFNATGMPIMHHVNPTPFDSWAPYAYNRLDSSSGHYQAPPHPAPITYPVHQTASNLAQSTVTQSFPGSQPQLPHVTLSEDGPSSSDMAQYSHDPTSGNFIHYAPQYIGPASEPARPPASTPHNHVNNASHLSPLMTHQPLSHARGPPMSAQAAQPIQIQMPIAIPDAMNGYSTQSLPDMPFRTSGASAHDLNSPPAPVMMIADDLVDGRTMYQSTDRAPPRFGIDASRVPLSPGKNQQGWPLDGHRLDTAFAMVPQTPLMETSVMAIEDGGWESQEPARKTARAVIANMTEQERLERRREQNRVSQAKLRKTRDAQYDKVVQERNNLQERYDQLLLLYNRVTAELNFFHDKELMRYNAKREQKGISPYASFEHLVSVESDLASQILLRQEQRQQEDQERAKEPSQQSGEPPLDKDSQQQNTPNRRSSDEHSQSAASEQMDRPISSSGTDTSLTSVPASQSTVNGAHAEASPFSYTVSSSAQGPVRRTPAVATKPSVRRRKSNLASPTKKINKRRPTSQRSEDTATADLSNSMFAMAVPLADFGQQTNAQMHSMSAPTEGTGSYFMAQAPLSGMTR
ncbi:hypothetical protein NliqN6_2590 [Naganishia liquefaciens]|uniref:BZIP domain-containing protein n=1 Tax=Naganishia liquefaciens TaxID=104408 RepID=A0A8H3TS87_9TREE|nr:hypothetical protein NliqN6_2590 [Naganishia liquefaciens]